MKLNKNMGSIDKVVRILAAIIFGYPLFQRHRHRSPGDHPAGPRCDFHSNQPVLILPPVSAL